MANTYGTYSPRALEPYPIESTLAQQATGGSSADAANLLDQYWLERQAHQNLYGEELDQQHALAQQQVMAQLADARAKGIAGLAGHPGGYNVAVSMGMIDPNDPNVQQALSAADTAQQATNLSNTGKGLSGYASGGYVTGDPNNPANSWNFIGTPATISANARLAAAALKAKSDAALANQPTVTYALPADAGYGTGSTISQKIPVGVPYETSLKPFHQLGANLAAQPSPAPTDTPTPVVIAPKKEAIPARPQTSLPAAPSGNAPATPSIANLPPGSTLLSTATKEGAAAQNAATQAVSGLSGNKAAQAILSPQGAAHTIYKDPNGGYWIVGRNNTAYPMAQR